MNGYLAGNAWAKFVRLNGRTVKSVHVALMSACYQIANEEKWVSEFQLPTKEAMQLSCIRDKETFYKTLKELVSFGAITILEESKNIYTARWVSFENLPFYLSEIPTATPTATPTDTPSATPIDKPTTNLPNNKSKETIESNKTTTTSENFGDGENSRESIEVLVEGYKKSEEQKEAEVLKEKAERFRSIGKDMFNDQGLIEVVCMNNKFSLGEFKVYLPAFIEEKIQEEVFASNMADAKRHFMNWVRIRHSSEQGKVIALPQNQIPVQYRMKKI